MDKHIKIEGSPASKMVQMMRSYGYNRELTLEVGTVLSPLPNLSINLESDSLTLDKDDLIIATTVANLDIKTGDQVIVLGDNDSQFYYVIDGVWR